jgi:molybdopterin-guanine dinucleotide biosynthesis protein A
MPVASKNSTRRKKVLSADVSGVILAGGKSSRYGANKAFVEVDGIPLIERVAGVLQSIFEQTVIVTNSPEEYSYLNMPMRRDVIPGLGPLGGILTGLQMIPGKAGFFVACDMPFLSPDLIRYMVGIKDPFDVVVPKITWKIEALHALYGTKCIPFIEKLIQSGNYQIVRLFQYVSVRYVGEDEIVQFDPELRSFFNINRPEEIRNMAETGECSHEKERRYRKGKKVQIE